MVFNLSPFTLVALLMIALFLYGPDKLPKAVGDAARGLRRLRTTLRGATEGVRKELGPDYQDLHLSDLNPRAFIRKHLLEEERTWERPEPVYPPGPRREGWPSNVPYPSAVEMGMPEEADPITTPIPLLDKPPAPPAPGTSADPSAPVSDERTPHVGRGTPADRGGQTSPEQREESGEPRETARSQA
ncbi:twin-arginine translocase TatA/TatE family subunit [Streptomyces sp. S.PB5]|uniref:twin-arginine translocase TatA/TatE family subunit n=1 Tax=Streptomyces sp. S.PB5 TaxID=3020844 RepID=UPI0025AF98C9|nr:twin-arginine translocase TatA/TatE family subunit [Streptomyces sp. S.PB5]MDN3022775.1 twin-arginine translocase TatA/TatE family subunit [Streptomyces sp. S.PB5]